MCGRETLEGRSGSGSTAALVFVTGLFSGYSPVAPGTAGSFLGLLCFLIPGFADVRVLGAAIAVVFAAGVFASGQFSTDRDPDPSFVVVDEIVGMWIALFFLPITLPVAVCSFLLFRLLDVVKPFPARRLEQLDKGWGIMLDDVAAGIYANVGVRLILLLFPCLLP